MHVVYEAADPLEATIVRDYLREAGLDAQCLDELAWGGRGELPANLFPRVAVRWKQEIDRARELLAEYERRPRQPDWRCRECGETVDGSLGLCWNCGAQAPGAGADE
ncbi:DUF2007 domain-containing protein [Algiphilus sp.]|uniref:putative signal transducing protein n=1 Tax=Algiphilus sp. TaxID=1872431 RepID=UPI0025B8BC18|nr:DUF2007 domain-containing protein [Algiphilus sp.]MCK5769799.1 DUF2007 domain-containing protein [Algiphilus sp.]